MILLRMAKLLRIQINSHRVLARMAGILFLTATFIPTPAMASEEIRLITLDPAHFHASLVQNTTYPGVNTNVHVYAPGGAELQEHLKRIESFNQRATSPTHWLEKVYTGPDFLERMCQEKAGNVVVIAGNNSYKSRYLAAAIEAGFNVLADKPMAINPEGFLTLRHDFERAAQKGLLLYDIMTERYEINSILQRELTRQPELFGTLEKGTADDPAVVMESVHHFFKTVAGRPLIRPPWFFDPGQQGESVPDVGTHLVDLVQWICFPDQALDWRQDVKVSAARHWPTKVTLAEFKRATGLAAYPEYLRPANRPEDDVELFANGDVHYALRGVHVRIAALWKFEAPAGGGDSHFASVRGTRATIIIRQAPGAAPILLAEPSRGRAADDFEARLRRALQALSVKWPGLEMKPAGTAWEIQVPTRYHVGHEAHFGQVTAFYLRCLAEGKLPDWEVPNMLAKYYTTTEAYRLSNAGK